MSEPTRTRAPEPDGPTVTSGSTEAPNRPDEAPAAPPGYELRTLIGSGGMGAVYRARDCALARDVAIKFLHARFAPNSVTAWRFTEEARITARLQHPGIPPIHQVGFTPDGRPFLAMKLIKGDTLDELLKARKTPADDRGRFVGIFEQAAQAVGFAHSRRIIHRDLKPANVMVGDFGEVQVMDWGLAKELGEDKPVAPERSEETLSVELRSGRDGMEATQAGSLLGTPAYMAPEQAVGAIDQVNERSDVFGLGAVLCVILTGKPPFVADSAESARVLAARGKLDDAFTRLGTCGAEPELVALAKKCLAAEAGDRPANAGEVANAVAAFRADAERRARQAEMNRATAEVKATEERKRRRVQRMLALAVLGLLAIAGYTARRIDNEQTRRRADQEAQERRGETEQKEREAALHAQQLATERDVIAAINEVQVLREEGWKQADDPARWALTLTAARSALKRAEGLLVAGKPTDALVLRVSTAHTDLQHDERNRALLAELDRITEENDVRFLIPVVLTRNPSDRYAAAFRAHGIDLMNVPPGDAVAWLKAHPFRQRLRSAIRNWQSALPTDTNLLLGNFQTPAPLAAVGGEAGAAAYRLRPTLGTRLRVLADAVTDDPFALEWWAAVAAKDNAALKRLLGRPEFGRLSSGELSALADGLMASPGGGGITIPNRNEELLTDLLHASYERFPGEFWVNFRLADRAKFGQTKQTQEQTRATKLRHLNAAVAARPRSAIARVALGAELWQQQKSDPTGLRIVRGAIELDPNSPWPHLFLTFMAMESNNWPEVRQSLVNAVRADPDTGFLMASTFIGSGGLPSARTSPLSQEQVLGLIEDLIRARPEHPGGYDARAGFHFRHQNYRGALEDYRAAKARMQPDYLTASLIQLQIGTLERMAEWGAHLPAVLRGELKPTGGEYAALAEYCAGFDQKFALAARFAGEALAANPKAYLNDLFVPKFAGWAIRASRGEGADAANLTALQRAGLRQQALAWLRELKAQAQGKNAFLGFQLRQSADLAPVREPAELAKLPPEERVAWEKFWADFPSPSVPKAASGEPAPPPHEPKR